MIILLLLATLAQDFPGDMPISRVLIDGERWQCVSEGHQFTEGPAVDREGNVYFSDIPASKIHKIDLAGKVTLFAENTAQTNGLMVGPDGRLYGCRNGEKKIVAYAMDGTVQTLAEDVESNDIVVNAAGEIWFSDPKGGKIWYLPVGGKPKVVAEALKPNGLILTPDQGTLVVTDSTEPVLWAFRVQADGSLAHKDRYCQPLRMVEGRKGTGADGMTVDKAGRIYVATAAGLQMFDPTGRLGGVIAKPQDKPLSNVVFGGPEFAYLYVTCGDKVYRRKTKSPGEPYFLRAKPK
jgi:sugar lactone lactonase YvrE